jgi:hypothetical protein
VKDDTEAIPILRYKNIKEERERTVKKKQSEGSHCFALKAGG